MPQPTNQPNIPPRRRRARADSGMKARTMFCVAVFIIAGFGLLIYQLYALQLRDAELYRTEAVTQQMKDITLPALRGSIYSVNGKLLAKSNTVWNIVADPSSIAKSGATEAQLRTAAQELADLLADGTTADALYEILTAKNANGTPYQYRMLAKGVEKPVADAIVSYADTYRMEPEKDGTTGKRILYLSTEQASTRSYPYGEFLASVLGFCNSDGEGAYGLEKYYNETLAGTPGRSVAETDVNGNALASGQSDLHEAIDGNDLYLTIDENVQAIVEQYLTEAMNTFTVHGRGSAIVMNVKTGAILAMASIEQFDPNDPYKITDAKMTAILDKEEIDAEDIDWLEGRLGEKAVKDIIADGKISRDKTVDEDGNEVASEYTQLQGMMREAQWKNKNITELYMPGSVFKLITASAGLDSGIMSTSQTFYCGGSLTVNEGSELWEHTYRCANGEVHYEQDMAGALNHSCNLWFIQAAETLKPQIFYDYIQAFGFTQPTGIDLPNETRWTSVYNAEQMAEVDTNLYTAAFGQNESITPMQMATAVAAIANGGYLVTPYVVDSVTDKDGNIVTQTETSIRRQVISEEVSRQLLSMMENNVHGEGNYHSCANAYVAGYRIGGKSGTAERTDRHLRGDGDYYKMMSFAAVLPIDDPEIEVFVLLDDPRWFKDYASQVVAPVVGNIISEIAPYLGVEQDAAYNPTGTVKVQTCLEYTWTNAQVTLNRLGLKHKLIGPSSGTIVYQYPVGGSVVPAGSTVYLYTATDQNAMTTVPDVTGKTGTFAEQMLRAANLNVQFSGDSSGKVVAQDVQSGTTAAYGTIVTLTMDTGAEAPAEEAPAVEENIDPANEEG
ncbi:MAG: penicillin-binding transpeptidase domain-containing protein [Gemmiger sp.]|uniref:penicillin-binding transpeptidase domain-containing protein n=1 Tax=Gemmiger sp. TaxID=2049027 RepID=UPI002E799E5A|nr:penicillin-binding transpeptidase domain-containing protein [Gemmiger sp.]MEE1421797.1 penicillin-binding transpeptidase domain-containing protein [Gemmiger sp.]